MKYKYEYIWLDGYQPEPNLRSKTKVIESSSIIENPEDLPLWNFDGSSTQQAEGKKSDCILKPVKCVIDPARKNSVLVLCEVLNPDMTPHESNTRSEIDDIKENWWGFEQEYVLFKGGSPLGFNPKGQAPQGKYYCGVGTDNVAGREIVEKHLDLCLEAGLGITGINAEVLIGQWEFQVFGHGVDASDQLWIARYLLNRVAEEYGVTVEYSPKPLNGDWNGSGLHTNFSTDEMRESGKWEIFESIFSSFEKRHKAHIEAYGSENDKRLTGLHETQHIGKFSWGLSDRGASIRIPQSTLENRKGYLEDRRPAANADPYKITQEIQTSLIVAKDFLYQYL